jgi:hypothetical protein
VEAAQDAADGEIAEDAHEDLAQSGI